MATPLSQLIRDARLRRGLTPAELATLSGVSKSSISRLEAGKLNPSFEMVRTLLNSIGFEASEQLRPKVSDAQMFRFLDEYSAGLIADSEAIDRLRIAAQTAPLRDRPGLRYVAADLREVLAFLRRENAQFAVSGLEACSNETSFEPIFYLDPELEIPWAEPRFGQRGSYILTLDARKVGLIDRDGPDPIMPSAWALMDAIASPGRQSDVALDLLDASRKAAA